MGVMIMAQATFSVRMDETLKSEFESLCNYFGMNMSTAINVFARAVVRERRIPFEIVAPDPYSIAAMDQTFDDLHAQAVENGVADMSMEEIDEEIAKARKGIGK